MANPRLCPIAHISLGAHQHPIKNPKKCADPSIPISEELKPNITPDKASKGPNPPVLNCKKTMESIKAANEIIIRIEHLFVHYELSQDINYKIFVKLRRFCE